MHIAFCVNDGYAPYIGVTIKSLLENNRSGHVDIHVLSDDISDRNVKRLRAIAAPYDSEVHIHMVDADRLRGLKLSKFTVYAWLRVLLPQTLPDDIHRVLYLDSDIVVTDDLGEMYHRPMEGISTAGVIDYPAFDPEIYQQCELEPDGKYVCSGVLLLNLDYWRKHDLTNKIIAWADAHGDIIVYPDQDAINHVCHDTLDVLPMRYGVVGPMLLLDHYYEHEPEALRECIERPAIIHYNTVGPWCYECEHPMLAVWDRYNAMLGRRKATLRSKYNKTNWLNRLKTRIWYATHPLSLRHKGPEAKLREQMMRYGLAEIKKF